MTKVVKENISTEDNVLILHNAGLTNEEIADTLNDLGYIQENGRKISRRFVKLTIKAFKSEVKPTTGNRQQATVYAKDSEIETNYLQS